MDVYKALSFFEWSDGLDVTKFMIIEELRRLIRKRKFPVELITEAKDVLFENFDKFAVSDKQWKFIPATKIVEMRKIHEMLNNTNLHKLHEKITEE